jgi:hypothetical protein
MRLHGCPPRRRQWIQGQSSAHRRYKGRVSGPASRASFANEPWRTNGGESALRLLAATAASEIRRDATTTWTAPGSDVREGGAAGALLRDRGDTAASISSRMLVVACVVRRLLAGTGIQVHFDFSDPAAAACESSRSGTRIQFYLFQPYHTV